MVARPFPEATSHSQRAGEDVLVDTTTGALFPAAPTGSLLLSSVPHGWRGIIVEWHRLPPRELSQHYVVGHAPTSAGRRMPFSSRSSSRYRYALSAGGHFMGSTILGDFFLRNNGLRRATILTNAFSHFGECANMVRPALAAGNDAKE